MHEDPQLPLEMVIMIFLIAASDHRATAATLCLVSRWAQKLVEPILYRVRVLKSATQEDTRKHLYSPKSLAFLRCLGILHGPMVIDVDPTDDSPLRNVRNFATDSAFYITDVVITDVEEFHLLASRPFGRILFPRLKRLHYSGRRVPQLLLAPAHPVRDITCHNELTHVAFSVPEDTSMSNLIKTVKEVLKEHKPLRVFYIRLLRSTSLVLRGAADYESIGPLASIEDRRFVVRRMNIDASAEALVDEWEQNALNDESLWDWAQSQVDGRNGSMGFL